MKKSTFYMSKAEKCAKQHEKIAHKYFLKNEKNFESLLSELLDTTALAGKYNLSISTTDIRQFCQGLRYKFSSSDKIEDFSWILREINGYLDRHGYDSRVSNSGLLIVCFG